MQATAARMQISSRAELAEEVIAERRLWTAILMRAVEDWREGTLRARREAQKFLFEDDRDFNRVCTAAGLDPGCLRNGLSRVGTKIQMETRWAHPLVAQAVRA